MGRSKESQHRARRGDVLGNPLNLPSCAVFTWDYRNNNVEKNYGRKNYVEIVKGKNYAKWWYVLLVVLKIFWQKVTLKL